MSEIRITGGCQCGAVRYAFLEQPGPAHLPLPHVPEGVRLFFAPLVGVPPLV